MRHALALEQGGIVGRIALAIGADDKKGVRGRLQLRGRGVVERLHGDGPTSGVQWLGALLGQLLGLPGLAGVGDEDGAMAAGQRGGLRLGVQAGAAVALVERQAQQGVGQQQGQCPGPAGGVGGEQVRHGAQGLARRGLSQVLPPRRGCIGWLRGCLAGRQCHAARQIPSPLRGRGR